MGTLVDCNKKEIEIIAKELNINSTDIISIDVEQDLDDGGYYYKIYVYTTFSGRKNYTRIIANDYDDTSIDVVNIDGFDLDDVA